ncbi:MAG: hypothetical protein JO199_08750 [Candidatus Eremiobacteraeota bacterium]|nr:hypothetical protein [Candidatus Eremiobacteraeota bacterium]
MITRSIFVAAIAFALGIAAPSIISAAERGPFLVVDGDGWLASGADHDTAGWRAIDPARPAFGLQMSERNDLPFDKGTAGATFWVRNANCGYRFTDFGQPCGWQLGMAVTQFRSLVVGGDGIEVDGLGLAPPYGRVINASDGNAHLTGLLSNEFVDFSGVDRPSESSWFSGFDLTHDRFAIRRAAAGSKTFADTLDVDADGNATVAGDIAAARATQHRANQWATRAQLVRGSYTFTYAVPFQQPPVCVATPEGSSRLRVTPAAAQCIVTSDDANDASTVDIVVIGDPK